MRKLLFLLVLISFWTEANSQSRAWKDLGIIESLIQAKELDSAHALCMTLVANPGDSFLSGPVYNNLGVIELQLQDFASAIDYFNRALEFYPPDTFKIYKAYSHYNLGFTYKKLGDFERASEQLYQAMEIFETEARFENLIKVLSVLGNLHREMEDFEISESFLLRALSLSREHQLRKQESYALNNLGRLYITKNDLEKALAQLSQSLNIKVELKDSAHMASVLYNLGELNLLQKNLSEAKRYFRESLRLRQKFEDWLEAADCHNFLAQCAFELLDFNRAQSQLDSALELATTYNGGTELLDNYKLRKNLAAAQQDWKSATDWGNRYLELYEDVADKGKRIAIQKLNQLHQVDRLNYEFKELSKASELQRLQLENERSNRQLLLAIIVGIIAVCLLLGLGIINQMRFSRKLEAKNERIDRLRKEVDHRTKNNLQQLLGLLDHRSTSLEVPEALRVANEVRSQVNVINLIHKNLAYQSESNPSEKRVSFDQYLETLARDLLLVYDHDGAVGLDIETESVMLDEERAQTMGLVANEVLCNALKYGVGDKIPEITIRLKKESEEEVFLMIGDNGKGFPSIADHSGSGLRLIRGLCQQIDVRFETEDRHGLIYRFWMRT